MKPRIMIVEDEPGIVDAIQYALETEGFETLCFPSGTQVVSSLADHAVDLIILDVGLPDMSGFELCKQIRQLRSVPIIFLTARADEIDRIVGLEIGADDYITKPFSPREVSARVKAVLRRTGTGNKPSPCTGTFAVNESKRQISYLGRVLDLSRYEFDILKTFIRRPGHVFSRDQLMQIVWEHPDCSLDRTIDAHIKNIRAKLRTIEPGKDPIVTYRGTGYALREDL
ncbi:winged helix-turn-helix transcriptional response regulator CreB [Geotalea daltonii FRC-32]|uniref:Winged helix-turn-helix transcriptional response regulator CreB n=1 Tax=Geotalea daltonii (strain DSM 22248 / JCM 15807 / FRC-32) TaxID=316067 RepID=B9M6W7_GEODF|nr:two-component system response regulator CreB [Geotalea daltonii]ACM21988.1 winged helix-turn-helix transcriptional response regulator CreB [Geotalea daltonii FRC-32]